MKVLHVNKLYYPHIGGIEYHVQTLASGLKGRIDVEVLVANEKFKTVVEYIDGVKVTKVASIGRFLSAPVTSGFVTQLRKIKPDIYHFHFPNPTAEASFLLARPRGKLIVTYHSDIIRQKAALKFYRPFLERFLNRADLVIASSPNLIKNSPFLSNISEKCKAIPFGISSDWLKLTPEVKRKADAIRDRYGPKIAFFLGRLIYYKGVDYLIKAMRNVEGKLIIAGEGKLGPELKNLANELKVSDKVHFVGALASDELAAYYHACDIFVLPSVESSEAFGFVQIEAHACGKPVISTDLPTGVPFVNQDGVSGLVVPPKDVAALSNAINRLFSDDALRERLGKQAKERFEREFTIDIMVDRVYEAYKEVLECS
ncbi:MAG: glycosyltransferase [Actinomycetota bacterium]|nr:glycosyltransferase [Actinomycetota bacterium]